MGCSQGARRGEVKQPELGSTAEDADQQVVGQSSEQEDTGWVRLGGREIEEALSKEWVKLVRADWLIRRAEKGGALARRQEMPPEAYVGLDELRQAGPGVLTHPLLSGEWLRVIVLSYPWLQPGHPDPHGENLRRIAEMLRHFVRDSFGYDNGRKPHGVLIDFTALFQVPRTKQEHADFLQALPALNIFYSHPSTIVLKVTEFPEGYPNHPSFHYERPEGANTVAYSERGWCFAESAMSGLVKPSNKVLDLSRLGPRRGSLCDVIVECRVGRTPPLNPDDFKGALDEKVFTSKGADFEKVARLYSAAFERRLGSTAVLDYSCLGWGANAARQLARAIEGSRLIKALDLHGNGTGGGGAVAILEALQRNTGLALDLVFTGIGVQGAVALGAVLRGNSALQTLKLSNNGIRPEGAVALGAALQGNSTLQTLELGSNGVGEQGAAALAAALQRNSVLRTLGMGGNNLSNEGAVALGTALKSNRSLQHLGLRDSSIGDEGAVALGQALQVNRMLRSLNLSRNGIGGRGAAALGQALEISGSLQTLDLGNNTIDDAGATALAKALRSSSSLQKLGLESNGIGHNGATALAQALHGSSALLSLNLQNNDDISSEAKDALRQAAQPAPFQLLV